MEIVIASLNLHKIREIRSILKSELPFDFLTLLDFPDYKQPEESGSTFEENAFIKATHAARALKRWVIADDSGLVVPALQDRPGVKSKRFSSENATDRDNREKLIKELELLPESERSGYYACALALASPEGVQNQVLGRCEGSLLVSSRGSQGFGYDPLFLKLDYNMTLAEMNDETKNKVSHRRKALDKLLPFLNQLPN
ncbi:MAG: Non-canonical purine NTP pyrophosphatase [Chlamydiae bacterium]|nr:Non-canonical purine NTP pyrophosphatase [Chlamydiota bacterium]